VIGLYLDNICYVQTKAVAIVLTLTYEGSLKNNVQDMIVLDEIHSFLCTSLSYCNDDNDAGSEFEEVVTMLKKTSLSEKTLAVLERALKQCVCPDDAMYKLMSIRMPMIWTQMVNGTLNKKNVGLLNSLAPIMPRMEKATSKLLNIINVNRAIYLPTYNMLLAEQSCVDGQ